jgi:hypothetical protein
LTNILRTSALAATVAIILALVFPAFDPGYRDGHDTNSHVTYVYLFDEAIRQGQFPVRWIEGPWTGYSQPLFNFYQVGLYYIVELVHTVVPRLSRSLTLTVALLWCLGSGFTFLWLKRLGTLPAALGTVMFALSPYVIQDVFVRAAYPEFAAICFAPGVLWALDRLLTTGRLVFVPLLAMLLCLMLICHLPATMIVSPLIAAAVVALVVTKQARPGSLLKLTAAGALALGLSAFYLVPVLAEMEDINIQAMTTKYADFRKNFVLAKQLDGIRYSPLNEVSFQLGISQWAAMLLGVLTSLASFVRRSWSARDVAILAWLGAIGLALFMTNGASLRVWESLPPLAFIQFPWRFFLLVAIAGAALAATLLSSIRGQRVQAGIVLVAIGLHLPLYLYYQRPDRLILREQWNIDDPAWRQTAAARKFGFYQSGFDPIAVTDAPDPLSPRAAIVAGQGTVRAAFFGHHVIRLDVQAQQTVRLSINSHYFPGWRVSLDGHDVSVRVTPNFGFMEIDVPPGMHRVEARFGNTPVRTAANTITVVTAFAIVLLLGWSTPPFRRR